MCNMTTRYTGALSPREAPVRARRSTCPLTRVRQPRARTIAAPWLPSKGEKYRSPESPILNRLLET